MITIITHKPLIDERTIRIDPDRLKKSKDYCASRRSESRSGRRGWSKDKENKSVAAYDANIYWRTVSPIVDPIKDPIERDKVRKRILNQLSCFKTTDGKE